MTKSRFLKCFAALICLFQLTSCQDTSDFYLLDQVVSKKQPVGKQLADYHGKWLVINFWAEWCAPCLKEIPELNLLHRQRESLNLEIIGVSYDPLENHKIMQLVQKWAIEYPIMATDPIPYLPFPLPNSLPGNYIINPDGELVAKLKGEQTFESLSKLLITLKKQTSQSE